MIAALTGTLHSLSEDGIVVDVGGVGYAVAVSARTFNRLPAIGEQVSLWIETKMSDDDIRLYGFLNEEERALFRLLQTVQGVAAKVALGLLSVMEADELRLAIASGDVGMLTQAKGVGPKLARRVVSELGDKLASPFDETPQAAAGAAGRGASRDAISALVNLGYRPTEANAAVATAVKSLGDEADVSEVVRESLKELAR